MGGKYINSPKTLTYDKGTQFYGVDEARDAAKRLNQLIVVEGFLDAILMHQFGFENCVGAMGTALSVEHVQQIARLGCELVLLLDGDAAGQKRSAKLADMLIEQRARARIASLLGGDPAEILVKDPQLIKDAIEDAVSPMQFVINSQLRGIGPLHPDAYPRLVAIAERLVHMHPVDREVYIHQLARYFQISIGGIKKLVNSIKAKVKTNVV